MTSWKWTSWDKLEVNATQCISKACTSNAGLLAHSSTPSTCLLVKPLDMRDQNQSQANPQISPEEDKAGRGQSWKRTGCKRTRLAQGWKDKTTRLEEGMAGRGQGWKRTSWKKTSWRRTSWHKTSWKRTGLEEDGARRGQAERGQVGRGRAGRGRVGR